MKRGHALKRTVTALLLAIMLTLSFGPSTAPAGAQAVAAAGLAAVLLKALPTIGTVVGNLFRPKTTATQTKQQSDAAKKMAEDSETNLKVLGSYVTREQILAILVTASGTATSSVARMNQIVAGQTQLTQSQLDDLGNLWPDVTEALDSIAKSNPKISVFESDSLQIKAINNILSADKGLKEKIDLQLKYNPAKPDATLLKNLQANLVELEGRFNDLHTASGIELNTVADQLAAVAATNPAPSETAPKPKSVEDASQEMLNKSFDHASNLNKPVDKSIEALKKSLETPVRVF